jgi:hypothetical protein
MAECGGDDDEGFMDVTAPRAPSRAPPGRIRGGRARRGSIPTAAGLQTAVLKRVAL